MTRSKIQRIKFFVFLLIFLLFQIAACDGIFREKRQVDKSVPLESKTNDKEIVKKGSVESKDSLQKPHAQIHVNNVLVNNSKKADTNITSKAVSTTTILPTTTQISNGMHIPSMDSGALTRGIFVIVGLGVLVMAYMVFRNFRLSKTRAQMVRKYGVLAHRQDVEMRPLPLDEDDEDDTTVFDASNISSNRLRS